MNKQEFEKELIAQAEMESALATMTNAEIADLLIVYVWGEMNSMKPSAVLVSAAVDRLHRSNDV